MGGTGRAKRDPHQDPRLLNGINVLSAYRVGSLLGAYSHIRLPRHTRPPTRRYAQAEAVIAAPLLGRFSEKRMAFQQLIAKEADQLKTYGVWHRHLPLACFSVMGRIYRRRDGGIGSEKCQDIRAHGAWAFDNVVEEEDSDTRFAKSTPPTLTDLARVRTGSRARICHESPDYTGL